jgi:hypothetical protein
MGKRTKKDTNKSGREDVRDVRAIVGRSSAFVAVVPRPCNSYACSIYKSIVFTRDYETLPLSLSVPSCLDNNPPSFFLKI